MRTYSLRPIPFYPNTEEPTQIENNLTQDNAIFPNLPIGLFNIMGEYPDAIHSYQESTLPVIDSAGDAYLATLSGTLGQPTTRLWDGESFTQRKAAVLSTNLDLLVTGDVNKLQPGSDSFASLVVWQSSLAATSNSTIIGKRQSSDGKGWNTGLLTNGDLLVQCSDGVTGSHSIVIPGTNWDNDWHYCLQVIDRDAEIMYVYSDKGSGSIDISDVSDLSSNDYYGLGQKQGVALAPSAGGLSVVYSAYWQGAKAKNLKQAAADAFWAPYRANRAPLEPGDEVTLFNEDVNGGTYTGVKFIIGTGTHRVNFNKVTLNDCEVEFEGNARGHFVFDRCDFIEGSMYTSGESVVGVAIRNCIFEEHDGVSFAHKNCDLHIIEANHFIRMKGISVTCKTSGVTILHNNFENKYDTSARQNPHISIEPDDTNYSGGLCLIYNNRFGAEVGSSAGPPKYCIRLGPASPAEGTMTNIRILGNEFFGRLAGALSDSAKSPILLTKELKDCTIANNFMRNTYTGPALDNTALGNGQGPVNNVFDNRIEDEAFVSMSVATGWDVR